MPPKLLPSSVMRDGKFMYVNSFSAQEHASSKSEHSLNFRVMAVRDIKIYEGVYRKIYTYLGILNLFRS